MGEPATMTAALRSVLSQCLRSGPFRIEGLRRLSGGASRETWAFDVVTARPRQSMPMILRLEMPGGTAAAADAIANEAALLRAASSAGVPEPRVLAVGGATSPFGRAFIVMDRIEGETIPRRILRDEDLADVRPRLAKQCGQILAAIHRIPIDAVPGLQARDPLEMWREMLDQTGEPHPAFELALRWLHANRPEPGPTVVVHGDFRNGNLIVGIDGVRAVLDWELAHLGDPLEDLGWLCVKAWRFGGAHPVGGFGSYEELIAGYEAGGGRAVDAADLRWWEVFGTLRWGIICIIQAYRHLSGITRSVELATIGRRVCETEWDLLHLLP